MSKLNDRQRFGWAAAIRRLHAHYEHLPENPASWEFADGGQVNATFTDGEVFAQIIIDPYGNAQASIAELDWLHADSDVECGCDPCKVEQKAGLR